MGLKALMVLLTTDLSEVFGSLPTWFRALVVLGVTAGAGWTAHAMFETQAGLPARLEAIESDSLPTRVEQLELGQDSLRIRVRSVDRHQDTFARQIESLRQDVQTIRCIVEADAGNRPIRHCIDTG